MLLKMCFPAKSKLSNNYICLISLNYIRNCVKIMLHCRALELQLIHLGLLHFTFDTAPGWQLTWLVTHHAGRDARRHYSSWGGKRVCACSTVWTNKSSLCKSLSLQAVYKKVVGGYRIYSIDFGEVSSGFTGGLHWGLAVLALASPFHLTCLTGVNLDYPEALVLAHACANHVL